MTERGDPTGVQRVEPGQILPQLLAPAAVQVDESVHVVGRHGVQPRLDLVDQPFAVPSGQPAQPQPEVAVRVYRRETGGCDRVLGQHETRLWPVVAQQDLGIGRAGHAAGSTP
jgi:hypothetical protein